MIPAEVKLFAVVVFLVAVAALRDMANYVARGRSR
jgi:hypothetical protein